MATEKAKKKASKKKGGLKVKLVKSVIGSTRHQREVVRGLGLRRLHQAVERSDTPEVRGMVAKVSHLVRILEE